MIQPTDVASKKKSKKSEQKTLTIPDGTETIAYG